VWVCGNVGTTDIIHDGRNKICVTGTGVYERGYYIKACKEQSAKKPQMLYRNSAIPLNSR